MSTHRCIIVDDEQLARESLRRLVERSDSLVLVGEAASGDEALELAASVRPDVVFLDIRMPGRNGLEVASVLDPGIEVIFTTAYDEFAVTAFELQALDYLLKPFGRRRFERAVERLAKRQQVHPDRSERLQDALGEGPLKRLFVRERGKLVSVSVDTISHIVAADDYAELVTAEGRHLMAVRMRSLEQRLDAGRFVRIHRSLIVNLDHMEAAAPGGNGRWEVILNDGTTLTSSRSGASRLRDVLDQGR
jgi:two-component system LytT family response regulator